MVRTATSRWSTSRAGPTRALRPSTSTFLDVEAAVLALLDDLVEVGGPRLRQLVTEAGRESSEAACDLVPGSLQLLQEHGDLPGGRFAGWRATIDFVSLHATLQRCLPRCATARPRGEGAGAIPDDASPGAIASVLTTMLTQVSSHQRGFETWGVRADELVATMAPIVDRTLSTPQSSEIISLES